MFIVAMLGISQCSCFDPDFSDIFRVHRTQECIRQILVKKVQKRWQLLRRLPLVRKRPSNDGCPNMVIALQELKEATKLSGHLRRNLLALVRQAKFREQRHNVLHRILFEATIPAAPFKLRCIELLLVNSLDTSARRRIRNA